MITHEYLAAKETRSLMLIRVSVLGKRSLSKIAT
jgi:hypothetical protein